MSVTLLVTIALAVLIAAATAGFTSRSRSARTAVIGAGWTALPVGLWLTGVEWTAAAAQAIVDKEYRFASPVFSYDFQTGRVG